MANSYSRGDTVRLVATFLGSGGVVVEPANVYALIRNNLGSIGTYTYGNVSSSIVGFASVARVASGCYYMDIVPSADPPNGVWAYRFDSGGGITAAAGESSFFINPTEFL